MTTTTPSSPSSTTSPSLFAKLAGFQARYAVWVMVFGLLLGAASYPLVRTLGLNSDWTALLPKDKPSVRDLEQAKDRVGGIATLTLVIQSKNLDAMQRFAGALVPRLERLRGSELKLRSVEWNVAEYKEFIYTHRFLYASLDDLQRVRDTLDERIAWEHARRNPLYVDLGDEPPPDPRELIDEMRAKANEARNTDRFPGGYYVHPNRQMLAIFLRTDLSGGDASGAHKLMNAVNREVTALGLSRYAPDLKLEFAGDVPVATEEHDAIVNELAIATTLTIALVLTAIFMFFLKIRAIPVLGISLLVPVLATFAFAAVTVQYLNTATAFLGSIVIGNGVNPMIIWLARYFEERRKSGDGTDVSLLARILETTHTTTWLGTLSASGAAAISYGSLVITDFRGFRDFGIIGGVGMLLCWAATILFLPAVCVVFERMRPLRFKKTGAGHNFYGVVSSKVVFGAPKAIVVLSVLLVLVSGGFVAHALQRGPIEHDLRNLRSVRDTTSRAGELNGKVNEIGFGNAGTSTLAILVPNRSDVAPLRAELERRRDREHAPWSTVRSIDDLLPKDQERKIALLGEIRELLGRALDYVNEPEAAEIRENMPPEHIVPVRDEDLPESVARPFSERDGTRGRILTVAKREEPSIWDGNYLIEWSEGLRKVHLQNGTRPPLIGRAPIFADMLEVIFTDGPKAVLASFLATVLLVILSFRSMRERMLTLVALLIGVAWMIGAMAATSMKLNFLNFVAFPITFGIGVDYSVNVMRRYVLERTAGGTLESNVRAALEETGGAVILCSLTTIFGYISLLTSANLALNSFGQAMTISEITCLTAAVLTMPALMLLLERRRAKA